MATRLSTDLLLLKDLPQVFYGQRTFHRNSREGRFNRSSIHRIPSTDLLLLENLAQVFQGWRTFHRSSREGRPLTGLLSIQYLPQSLLWVEVRPQISYCQQTLQKSSRDRKNSTDFLGRKEFLLLIEYLSHVLYGQESFHRSHITRTPSTSLLLLGNLLQVFFGQRISHRPFKACSFIEHYPQVIQVLQTFHRYSSGEKRHSTGLL